MIDPAPDTADRAPAILIVEDDPDQRELIREALTIHYAPAEARIATAGTAAECLATDLAAFDVILLDYNLPDGEGLDLLGQVLRQADLPVIFVTGENNSALAAEAIQRGAQDYVVKMGDYLFTIPVVIGKSIRQHRMQRENAELRRKLELMLEELRVKNKQLEDSLDRLREMADSDHLTGLANRRRFAEELERQFSEAVRYGHDLSCCMCDLDHYKQLNDALGHQFGDRVLVATAEVIRSMLRRSDTAARYGGDEFVLLLPHTAREEALGVARRLRDDLAIRIRRMSNFSRAVSLSIGIASIAADQPTSADGLVSMADRALYAAKADGKDRVVPFSHSAETA